MFGSILALPSSDVKLILILSAIVILLYTFNYKGSFAVTFDERFAKATGINTEIYNAIIAFLSALTIVTGMKMMGAMLISALIIFPPLTAMRVCKTFKTVTIVSSVISVTCFAVGLIISVAFNLPAGASIVLTNAIVFTVFSGISKLMFS